MSQVTYRGNLSSAVFPFISEYEGRTVIVNGADNSALNSPQVYYGHNIMPSVEGFQSIGYTTQLNGSLKNIETIFTLQDSSGESFLYAQDSFGGNYVKRVIFDSWQKVNFIPLFYDNKVTCATINGQSYLYFKGVGCYMYDILNNNLIPVAMLGLDTSKVEGICDSAGYMIAWTSTSVAWSSAIGHPIATDPIDFVPSLITGAGGGALEELKGTITLCASHSLGFVVYSSKNAVAAVYSGNAKYPFSFKEIASTGGLTDSKLVTTDTIANTQYAYTTSGLQLVSMNGSDVVFPEVTDFLTAEYFETFNVDTSQFVTQVLTQSMKKAIAIVANRFLVISYGVEELTHAIVYDLKLKRYGKLKITHIACFDFNFLNEINPEAARNSIGFINHAGVIKTVDFSYSAGKGEGVLILGKYQVSRSRLNTLQEVILENIQSGDNFSLKVGASMDGKNIKAFTTPYLAAEDTNYRRYTCRNTGVNHSLLLAGNFYLTSLILKLTQNGSR